MFRNEGEIQHMAREEETIMEQVNRILALPHKDIADIVLLSENAYRLSLLYADYLLLTAEEEEAYAMLRTHEGLEQRAKGLGVTQAFEIGKKVAEEEYGGYRLSKAKAMGFKEILAKLDRMISVLQTGNKQEIKLLEGGVDPEMVGK